jgi:hypothetical protein
MELSDDEEKLESGFPENENENYNLCSKSGGCVCLMQNFQYICICFIQSYFQN